MKRIQATAKYNAHWLFSEWDGEKESKKTNLNDFSTNERFNRI